MWLILSRYPHSRHSCHGMRVFVISREESSCPEADEGHAPSSAPHSISATSSVAEYLEDWLWGKQSLRPSTHRSYETHVRRYFTPHLGDLPWSSCARATSSACIGSSPRQARHEPSAVGLHAAPHPRHVDERAEHRGQAWPHRSQPGGHRGTPPSPQEPGRDLVRGPAGPVPGRDHRGSAAPAVPAPRPGRAPPRRGGGAALVRRGPQRGVPADRAVGGQGR